MNEKNVVNSEDDSIIKNSSNEGVLGLDKKEKMASGTTLLYEESPEQNGSSQLKETLLIHNKENIGPDWGPRDRFLVLFTRRQLCGEL